jgi:predicted transcriptional regulator
MAGTSASNIENFMVVRAIRIRYSSSIKQAAETIALSHVSDLMVVDKDDNFRGVLSEGDVLRAAMPDISEILEEGGGLSDAFGIFLEKGRELSELPIAPLVIDEPIIVAPDDHIAKAAVILLDRQIRLLPVVEQGKLVGTISRADVCRAIVGTL